MLSVYDVPPDASDSTSVDTGAPTTLATTVPGQASKVTFQGSSGQQVYVMRTDVTSADLSGADLTAANLRKVNFTRANLTGADLTDSDVTGADLTGAILRTIRGQDRIRGLDKALNRDQAIFND